eukprot:4050057-Pyramimonas_sp.AAC.1
MVDPELLRHLGLAQDISNECERLFGLKLNVHKTDLDELQARVARAAQLWGGPPIAGKAKYLGVIVWPMRAESSWTAPFKDVREHRGKVGQDGSWLAPVDAR